MGVCPGGGGSAQGSVCLEGMSACVQTRVKTLPCRNYVEDGKKLVLNVRLTVLKHKGFGYKYVYTH